MKRFYKLRNCCSTNPVDAIRQQCDMLLRAGRMQELAQMKSFLDMLMYGNATGQGAHQGYMPYPGEGNRK